MSIKRFVHHKNPHDNFLPRVPGHTYRDILECIDDVFCLNNSSEPFTFFSSDDSAKSFFNKKLGYINNNKTNIFQFNAPSIIYNKVQDTFTDTGTFFMTFKDIESLYKGNQPTEIVIDFVLDCLNYHCINSVKNTTVPNYIFGYSCDITNVCPNKEIYSNLHNYFTLNNKKIFDTEEDLQSELKQWYSKHNKDFLTTILDKYQARQKFITNYVMIGGTDDDCNSLYNVIIPEDNQSIEECEANVINLSDTHPHSSSKNNAICLSKFFVFIIKKCPTVLLVMMILMEKILEK